MEDVFAVGDHPSWNRRSPDTPVTQLTTDVCAGTPHGIRDAPDRRTTGCPASTSGESPFPRSKSRIPSSHTDRPGLLEDASAVESLVICRVVAKLSIDRDITHTGLYALHSAPLSSSYITSTSTAQSQDIIPIHPQSKTCTETCASFTNQQDTKSQEVFSQDAEEQQSSADMDQDTDQSHTTIRPVGRPVDWSVSVDNQQTDEDIMQISGAGHWFLEGWIGDHAVDFLVDSGSAVTAVSRSFFDTLSEAEAPVGALRPTARKLRGANGSQIDISGCSSCVVSFLGLRTEFPILVCDLRTDAIIGTDTLGSILPHTHWT